MKKKIIFIFLTTLCLSLICAFAGKFLYADRIVEDLLRAQGIDPTIYDNDEEDDYDDEYYDDYLDIYDSPRTEPDPNDKNMTRVPNDLLNKNESLVIKALNKKGLKIKNKKSFEDYVGFEKNRGGFGTSPRYVGTVIWVEPPGNTIVEKGSTVMIEVLRQEHLVVVPKVIGEEFSSGVQILKDAGLEYHTGAHREISGASIVNQSPLSGEQRFRKTRVFIKPGIDDKRTVPYLFGKTDTEAASLLKNVDLRYQMNIQRDDSLKDPGDKEGKIYKTEPYYGSEVDINEIVYCYILPKGLTVKVPDLHGDSAQEAQAKLDAVGLKMKIDKERSGYFGRYGITSYSPSRTAYKESTVKIWITYLVAPPIVGLTPQQAIKRVEGAKLKYIESDEAYPVRGLFDPDVLAYQRPASKTRLKEGDVVTGYLPALKTKVPGIYYQPKDEASRRLESAGLYGIFNTEKPSKDRYKYWDMDISGMGGKVWKTSPDDGAEVDINSTVDVFLFPEGAVHVPNIKGMSEDDARLTLETAGLKMNVISATPKTFAPGGVTGWSPRKAAYPEDPIDVALEYPKVPNLMGKTEEAAVAAITGAGLTPDVSVIDIQGEGPGVFMQHPPAGSRAKRGQTVTANVANPAFQTSEVTVPNLFMKDKSELSGFFKSHGVQVVGQEEKPPVNLYDAHPPPKIIGKVWKQSPAAGTTVQRTAENPVVIVYTYIGPQGGVKVPHIGLQSEASASGFLGGVGLQMVIGQTTQSSVQPRGVVSWSPKNYAYQGDGITVAIEYPEVPSLTGKSQAEANAAVTGARLIPDISVIDILNEGPGVFLQHPAPGTRANVGDPVSANVANPNIQVKEDGDDVDPDDMTPPEGWSPWGPTIAEPDKPDPETQQTSRDSADRDLDRRRQAPALTSTSTGTSGPLTGASTPYDQFTTPKPPPVIAPAQPTSFPKGNTPLSGGGESGHGHGANGQDIPK